MRRVFVVIVCAFFFCATGCSDHAQGMSKGREDARNARGKYGQVGQAVGAAAVGLAPGKPAPNKSAEWNAGYRDGWQAEANGK